MSGLPQVYYGEKVGSQTRIISTLYEMWGIAGPGITVKDRGVGK
jgi:hypothetical protein